MTFRFISVFALTISLAVALPVRAACGAVIVGGSAEFMFDNNSSLFTGGSGPLILDRLYGTAVSTVTANDVAASIGGDAVWLPPSGLVTLDTLINGPAIDNQPTGRSRQVTELDVDFSNVLATWGGGEQVGIDAVVRTNVDPGFGGGFLVLGDFSLVNQAGTLTLLNNFQFPADAFTIGNPVFQEVAEGFTLGGDLLVGNSLSLLTSGVVAAGTDVGSFSMTVSAVPEPSSLLLLVASSIVVITFRRSRWVK